jgi:5-methyltetrahydrofolate--homocysteine methyltransferase
MQTTIQALLATGDLILADGGMGTTLFALGLANGESPEEWNVTQPDKVRGVHRSYIEAGSQIILTNTFGGSRLRLDLHGLGDRVREFNLTAARLARVEADAAPGPVVVGGSMGPTGSILAPYGALEFDDAVAAFAEQAAALVEGGVDVLWIETLSDLEEVRAAVAGCRRAAPGCPIVATMTFDTHGRTMMGVTPEAALETLSGWGLVALGGNCGNGPAEIEVVVQKMHAANPDVALVAKSNAGMPHLGDDGPVYDATPAVMAEYALTVRDLGARIIGACCGSTAAHIRAMADALGKASLVMSNE